MSTTTTIAGIVTGGVVIGALGYYLVEGFINPPPIGGSCNVPGTPCYTAINPYLKEWQYCYTQQQILDNVVAKQDQETPAQASLLAQYSQCLNYNAAMVSSLAAKFVPVSPANAFISILYPLAAEGILVAGGISALRVFGSFMFKTNGRVLYSQTATRSAGRQSTLRGQSEDGDLTPEEAQNASNTINSESADIAATQDIVDTEMADTGAVLDLTEEEVALAVSVTEDAVVSTEALEITDVIILAAA